MKTSQGWVCRDVGERFTSHHPSLCETRGYSRTFQALWEVEKVDLAQKMFIKETMPGKLGNFYANSHTKCRLKMWLKSINLVQKFATQTQKNRRKLAQQRSYVANSRPKCRLNCGKAKNAHSVQKFTNIFRFKQKKWIQFNSKNLYSGDYINIIRSYIRI